MRGWLEAAPPVVHTSKTKDSLTKCQMRCRFKVGNSVISACDRDTTTTGRRTRLSASKFTLLVVLNAALSMFLGASLHWAPACDPRRRCRRHEAHLPSARQNSPPSLLHVCGFVKGAPARRWLCQDCAGHLLMVIPLLDQRPVTGSMISTLNLRSVRPVAIFSSCGPRQGRTSLQNPGTPPT